MSNAVSKPGLDVIVRRVALKMGKKLPVGSVMVMAVLAGGVIVGPDLLALAGERAATAPAPLPTVVVSNPVQGTVDSRLQFLGQFSAVDSVDLRPQVGGTLTEINCKNGDLVKKGDLLFVVDPTPLPDRPRRSEGSTRRRPGQSRPRQPPVRARRLAQADRLRHHRDRRPTRRPATGRPGRRAAG